MTLQTLRDILGEAGIPVAHYKIKLTEYPYIVWRELATSNNHASGNAWREVISVSIDHFTKKAFDPSVDKLKLALLRHKISFTTAVIWYEDDELIQTQFTLSIARKWEVTQQ